MLHYTVRPISDRTTFTGKYVHSQFASSWSQTTRLLDAELRHLNGRDVVLEMDVEERHIRLDGQVRADARPSSPAVRLAFESKHGPLTYGTDRFWSWQDNVRAIALGLEALRKVDRYGITKRGEQYAGWKALPAGRAVPSSHMTRHEAYALLSKASGNLISDGESIQSTTARYRESRIAAHPDRNEGDHTLWHQIEEAGRLLGVAK